MLKRTVLSKKSTSEKLRSNNSKVDRFDIDCDDVEYLKKSEKLKVQKLFKSRKKLPKSGNLSKFGTKKTEPSFLTSNIKKTFNYL